MLAQLNNKTIVVKCGGAAMLESRHVQTMIDGLSILPKAGAHLVVVHGGGPEITKFSELLNIPVKFSKGQRITDLKTLELAQMVLFGKINRRIVSLLNQKGLPAVGLTGQDAAFIQAEQWQAADGSNLGYVGRITSVDVEILQVFNQAGFVPVIAPFATSPGGQTYNLNGDLAAGAVAGALQAEKLIMLTDVNGFYEDANDAGTRIPDMKLSDAKRWLKTGKVSGGMLPKLQACVDGLELGVKAAYILDAKMLSDFLQRNSHGIGTAIS